MKTNRIQRRTRGQTAVYQFPGEKEAWEWVYTPTELRKATWRQIENEARRGARIRVIQWPQGIDIFRDGKYLEIDPDEARAIREEEPL